MGNGDRQALGRQVGVLRDQGCRASQQLPLCQVGSTYRNGGKGKGWKADVCGISLDSTVKDELYLTETVAA